MRKILLLVLITCVSCVNLQNICQKAEYLDGEVVYAIPYGPYYRTVTLNIQGKKVVIYRVPREQPLNHIPVCKHNNKYYWVMP